MNKYMECYRGEVYYADLGEIDPNERTSEQRGKRPVIIIQNNTGNKFSPTVIVASISSQTWKKRLKVQVDLDYKYIGLDRESFAGLEQVRALDKTKLLSYVGKINEDDMINVDDAIAVSLGTEDRNTIRVMAAEINQIEKMICAAVSLGVKFEELLKTYNKEREMKIRMLENFCNNRGLNFRKYYKMYNKEDELYKKVG